VPYNDFQPFRTDYEVAHLASRAVHGNIPPTKAVDPGVAWNLYQHARNPVLGFHVFGRHIAAEEFTDLRAKKGLNVDLPKHLQGISFSSLDYFKKNFGYVTDKGDGSILNMGGKDWNFTVNDTWLLGGVHSRLAFYAASVISKDNILDNDYNLSITGRELMGLALFGYTEVHNHKALGVAYICTDRAKADAAKLTDYQCAVGQIKSRNDAASFFKKAKFKLY
jgi:hypothetical protein